VPGPDLLLQFIPRRTCSGCFRSAGESLRESAQWQSLLHAPRWQSLDKFKVPAVEQAELKAIVNSTYGDIVFGQS
jgi:hypothetical protein